MTKCTQCSREAAAGSQLCDTCASATRTFAVTPAAKSAPAPGPAHPSSHAKQSRFVPGDLLAGRYRIVALLGRGGMGEVYRADDLSLGQPVALKFLSAVVAHDQEALERFRGEVRIARQVSHPNVCRVYDLAEADGSYFLSMEYVDGEDLASLLRRIGRLPEDKGLEIARKLCAGLAAAHEQGVLHRDLKPGNVMLDGRGQVLLTDFGLAGLANEISGDEVRNGTPAYMAPEQLAGKEVTVRSDIYSLGLVLHEIFTGKRPMDSKTPTSWVRDLDPMIERVVLRCLEPDPKARPSSALAVSAALPGGDPLAAALAAGETPSPQMVAAAGEGSGLALRVAVPWLAGVLVAIGLSAFLDNRSSAVALIAPPYPPEVLRQKAADIVQDLGYHNRIADTAYGFDWNWDFLHYAEDHDKPKPNWNRIARDRVPMLRFWYRQSEEALIGQEFKDDRLTPGMVTKDDPLPITSGMINVELDARGRLVQFQAIPAQKEDKPPAVSVPDWNPLFRAAQLDPANFQEALPQWNFLAASDARKAWTGTPPGSARSLRLEAAALHGRPVAFSIVGPWTKAERMPADAQAWNLSGGFWFQMVLIASILISAPLLARRNLVRGHGDREGAFRIAAFMFVVEMAIWIFRGHFVWSQGTAGMMFLAICTSAFYGLLVWTIYLALEPYVRRRWPQALISSSNVLAGKLRDPIVGRDLLLGTAMGISWNLVAQILETLARARGFPPALDNTGLLLGVRDTIASFLLHAPGSVRNTLEFILLLFGLRVLLKREWLAGTVLVLLFTVTEVLQSRQAVVDAIAGLIIYGMIVFVTFRLGAIALAVGLVVIGVLSSIPAIGDPSAWYFGNALFMYLSVAAIAIAGFWMAIQGQQVWKGDLLE
ncbi:MAG: serine/threonine protein kinase [Acidobacteriota bacterium]|nr:serine/threonine protein kinase [Acidobacteriota bacterium]